MELDQAIVVLRDATFQKRWRFWEKKTDPKLLDHALRCLEEAPPEMALPQMAYVLWNGSDDLRQILEPIFVKHALALPVQRWFAVDEHIRIVSWDGYYFQARDEAFQRKVMAGSMALILIGLCHPSGHVRQKAVKLTPKLPGVLCQALLLVRVNDWVDPVRNSAVAGLEPLLPQLSALEKMELAPLLWELRLHTRHGRLDLIDSWERIIACNLDMDLFAGVWERTPRYYRKAFLNILKKSDASLSFDLCKTLLSSNDRGAIIWVIRKVFPTMDVRLEAEAAALIRRCKAVPVRREWLSYLIESKRGDASVILRGALLDTSRSIRRVAQYYSGFEDGIDVLAFYREAIKRPETEANALYGLAEIAPAEGHKEAITRLPSSVPAILKAAIFALSPETLGQHLETLINAAQSGLPGVPKGARQRLEECIRDLGTKIVAKPECWDGFLDAFQKLILHRAHRFEKWDALEFLLTHLEDPKWQEEVTLALDKWYRGLNGSFVKLSTSRRERLAGKVAELCPLNPHTDSLRKLLSETK